MVAMYHDVVNEAAAYYQESDHYVYISPQHFENFCTTYKNLHRTR